MNFGWINIFGIVIITIMLIPNIIYSIKNKNLEEKYSNKIVNTFEQIGRYMSMLFIIFPIGISGFSSVEFMLLYMISNCILLLFYLIIWCLYFRNKTLKRALLLAIIPTFIFLVSGIALKHLLLIVFSIIFGISHSWITYKNNI